MKTQLRQLHDHGRCSSEGRHELFFSEKPAELAAAQRICGTCPVRVQCLEIALREGHEWGVWGGVIFWDGQPFHRRRSTGSSPAIRSRRYLSRQTLSELWELVKSA